MYDDFDDLDIEIEKLFRRISKKRDRGKRQVIKCDFCGYSFEYSVNRKQEYPLACPICGNIAED